MIKRLALLIAASLLAGQALAQTLPPIPPVPDADRTVTYNVTSSTQTFSVPFNVYGGCSDLTVSAGVGQLQTFPSFTCSSPSGPLQAIPLPITDMLVTLASAVTSGSVIITGSYRPRNLTVPTAPGIPRREYEQTTNTIVAGMREIKRQSDLAAASKGVDYVPLNKAGDIATGTITLPSPIITGTLTAPSFQTDSAGVTLPGQGSVVAVLSPAFTDGTTIGLFVNPASYGTTDVNDFVAAYNMQHGKPDAAVLAGTKGNLAGYECNVNTNQTASDVTEGGHCFGGTIVQGNGAPMRGVSITDTINNVNAPYFGMNINITNNVANTSATQSGINISSTGTHNVTAGINLTGNFDFGLLLNGNSVSAAGTITFSGSASYAISGSLSDTLRIIGGGSVGGMILYGNSTTGSDGLIRFRNNSVDNTEGGSIDGGTGAFASASTVTAATGLTAGTAANGVTITQTAITRTAAGANLSITVANQLVLTAGGGVSVGSPLSVSGGFTAATTASFQSNTKWTKIAAATVAPGAGLGDIRMVPGTNAGTCKFVAAAGTSTTAVTIVDNVGSGC